MKVILALVLLPVFVSPATAQITIGSEDYLNSIVAANSSSFESSDTTCIEELLALKGPNQYWDFSGYKFEPGYAPTSFEVLSYPGGVPLSGDPAFTPSTKVFKVVTPGVDGVQYAFIKLNSEGYWLVGVVLDSLGKASITYTETPPLQQAAFPLTYQTSWHASAVERMTGRYTLIQTADAVVDGYGTLLLPGLPSLQTIRLKTSWTVRDSAKPPGALDTSYEYQWFTKEGYSASISASYHQIPDAGVSYSTPVNSSVAASIMPVCNIEFASGGQSVLIRYPTSIYSKARISLLDPLGRTIGNFEGSSAETLEGIVAINISSLARGTYFVRIATPERSAMQKFVVAH